MTTDRAVPTRTHRRRTATRVLAAGLVLSAIALPSWAQLGGLPRVTLPTAPRELPRLPAANESLQAALPLQSLRADAIRDLLRTQADVLEADPRGEPIRRQELLLVSPPRSTLDAALAQGFVLLREQELPALALTQVVLRAPPGMGTAQALALLRRIDPGVEADFNHLYTRSGDVAPPSVAERAPLSPSVARPRRVGLVDGGVDSRHAALKGAAVQHWGCEGQYTPSPHGTAVASLLVGRDAAFSGAAPEAALYAADIYCGQAAGGAVEVLVLALAWLAGEQVAVINVSLVGPPNRLLEHAVRALVAKGHLVVAAVGNDGAAAAPLFPASYPGVVGVTGVMPSRRVLPEAAQGPQVVFAAPGADLAVARPGGGYVVARGTSFAAPLVAGLLAESLTSPDPRAAHAAFARLAGSAHDLGTPGRDAVYGIGLVAEDTRIAPQRVQAALH